MAPLKKLLFGDMDSDLTYKGELQGNFKKNEEQNRFKGMFYS